MLNLGFARGSKAINIQTVTKMLYAYEYIRVLSISAAINSNNNILIINE